MVNVTRVLIIGLMLVAPLSKCGAIGTGSLAPSDGGGASHSRVVIDVLKSEVCRDYVWDGKPATGSFGLTANGQTVTAPYGRYFHWMYVSAQNTGSCDVLLTRPMWLGEPGFARCRDGYTTAYPASSDRLSFYQECIWLKPGDECSGWVLFSLDTDRGIEPYMEHVDCLQND